MHEKLEKAPIPAGTTYKPSEALRTRVLSNELLTEPKADEVRHIVIDLKGSNLRYAEGQSIGILPPGSQESGKPHKLRLYSIASASSGERNQPGTVGLCVKRLVEDKDDGSKYLGVASNFLCDTKPGDELLVTGPVGMHFLLPANDQTDLILIATGTGIAPFRAFLDHIYRERSTPWRGQVYLFFGAKYSNELIYFTQINNDMGEYAGRPGFHFIRAVSREETNADGSRVYVQHRVEENFEELRRIIHGTSALYMCGLKGMDRGVDEVFSRKIGHGWEETKQSLKKSGRWIVEVY
jgi:ferredoxin--NADP+ reductase